jgi:hypothetical protein
MTAVASPIQLRCKSKLQGIIKERADGTRVFEIRCKDKWCSERGAGIVVLHYFNVDTGELIETKKFRDPKVSTKGKK